MADALQNHDVPFYGFRNEQAAAYAAGAMGFMTGRPGLCLAVSGPGMMNCISGLANAMVNKWPMVLVGGANDTYHDGKGAF